jgi:Methyltransferase domain
VLLSFAKREAIPSMSDKQELVNAFRSAFSNESLVKLSLGKSSQRKGLQKVIISPVLIQATRQLKFVYRYTNRDVTKNLLLDPAANEIDSLLGVEFLSGTLFTTEFDLAIMFNRRREASLSRSKPTMQQIQSRQHNREKNYKVDVDRPFLVALGIHDHDGRLKPTMASKLKQIQRFVEIIDSLVKESLLRPDDTWKVVDIGSGKGYLTFALYDHLTSIRTTKTEIVGVERREDLVSFCTEQASVLGFDSLRFEADAAGRITLEGIDILIALHACNTATDDAIYQGISNHAQLIVCSPCCQHELAPQLEPVEQGLVGLSRFGLLKQRQADLVTDAVRTLLMESMGYRVKVIEFTSTEHTSKNLLLAGVKSSTVNQKAAYDQFLALKSLFGFRDFTLEMRLKSELDELSANL